VSDSLSDQLPDVNCDEFDAGVAELALEVLGSSERDALLAHAATCARCSTELQRMSVAADRLTLLAPDCEPPVGFEQRVMESLSTQRVKRLRPVRPVRLWHLAAAAVALFAVGVATGVGVHREPGSVAESEQAQFRYADLVDAAGGSHGSVTVVADHESTNSAVLTMSLVNLDAGQYHCVVHLGDGTTRDVAAWPIGDAGAGTWAIPISIAIDDIRGVSVRDDDGSTIAMTKWPAS
jgi:hypothetical protein